MLNSQSYILGLSSLHLIESLSFGFNTLGLAIRAYSPLYENFNIELEQMHSNGLAPKFLNDFIYPKGRIQKTDEIGPQILTMDDLNVAFLFCCVPLILSAIAFVGELFVFWSLRLWVATKERLIAATIVTTFYRRN